MGKRFRLERLLRLKERVEDEAKAELGRVQSQLGQAEVALGELRGAANGHQADGRVDLTLVHLSERGALSTAFAIEGFREEESEKLTAYTRAKLEHRQFAKLAERHRAARLKKEAEQERKLLDDWTNARFGRRK